MKEEIKVAVEWWADQLRGPAKMDNGDAIQSGLVGILASKLVPPTEHQIDIFKAELSVLLERKLPDHWKLDNPQWGGLFRVLSVDYSPCLDLSECASAAGIDSQSLRFPIKTVMWVNPGEVSVACGYGAPPQIIYGKNCK